MLSDAVASMLGAIVISAITSVITVNLSFHRFRKERWWEKKAEHYEKILNSLHDIKKLYSMHFESVIDSSDPSEEKKNPIAKNYNIALSDIDRYNDTGSFLMSQEAHDRIKQFLKDHSRSRDTTDWVEHLMLGSDAVETCLSEFSDIAKDDLGIYSKRKVN